MIIRPGEVHDDWDKALMGVLQTARDLGIECHCNLKTQWLIKMDPGERETFLSLAREAANAT